MKPAIFLFIITLAIVSCNNKKDQQLAGYNDRIVNIIEEADITMKSWNNSDIMQNYQANMSAAKSKIEVLQDSMKLIMPVGKDDTLRLSGMAVLAGYLQTFSIYDTIYSILSDSIYLSTDSVRVQNLLLTNKNLIEQQSASFAEIQKRFAGRYELQFMQ